MISVTMLSAYLYCKRKLFLEKVLQIAEPEKEALVLGKIRHNVFDKINKAEENLIKSIKEGMKKEDMRELFKKKYSKILRNTIIQNKTQLAKFELSMIDVFRQNWISLEHEMEFRIDIIYEFVKKEKIYGEELYEKLSPKIISEIYIESEKLGLKGIIDKLESFIGGDDKEGIASDFVIPVELKTGKAPKEGIWPSHQIQVAAYMLLLEDAKKIVPRGEVYYLDAKEKREVRLNPYLRDEIIELAKKVNALIDGKNIPPYCSTKAKCESCGIKNICYSENYINEKLKEMIKEI